MKTNLKDLTLAELESYYESKLAKVRDLMNDSDDDLRRKPDRNEMRAAEKSLLRQFPAIGNRPATPITLPPAPPHFKTLTKGDAAERILIENNGGPMRKQDIFTAMQASGHGVTSLAAFTSTLSADKRFKSEGDGKWSLAQPDLSAVNGSKKGEAT